MRWWWWGGVLALTVLVGCDGSGGSESTDPADAEASPAERPATQQENARAGAPGVTSATTSVIPFRAVSMFREGARSDLALSANGRVPLVETAYLPVESREDAWFVIGVDGRGHPLLFGRFRFQRYRDILLELFVQSHAPIASVADVLARELLAGITPRTTPHEVADLWESRTAAWEGGAAESMRPTVRSLRGMKDEPLGEVAEDGTLRAVALEAIHYATVIDRMRVFDLFSRVSGFDADRTISRARSEAGDRIKRRRAFTVASLVELLRFAPTDGSSPLAGARIPFVPARAAQELFPDVADSIRVRFGYDRRWAPEPFETVVDVQDVDATLTLLATLEHGLFADIPPTAGCGEDSGADFVYDAAVAIELRRYLGLLYAGYVAELLESEPDLVIEAWDEHGAVDRAMVDAAAESAREMEARVELDLATCDRHRASLLGEAP